MVTASTTLQLLLGWEIMGLCSFLLIGHWWEEKKNSDAALKAFFTTRTGDIGLLVGMSILFFAAGQTFNIARTNQLAVAGELDHAWLLLSRRSRSSSPASARAPSSPCTRGCPTPWPGPRRRRR